MSVLPARSVLIVDDDPVNRALLRRLVQGRGFATTEAPDGATGAMAALLGTHVLVLMDIMMPVMDGFAAIRRIRAIERDSGRATPIIAVTALTDTPTRNACMAAGADYYLPKPVEFDAFSAAIDAYCASSPLPVIATADPRNALDGPCAQRPEAAIKDVLDALARLRNKADPSSIAGLRSLLMGISARRALACLDRLSTGGDRDLLAREVRTALLAATTPCPP